MKDKKINVQFDFKGKSVIVTGGSMGIGYGIVRRFAEAGANVVIADISDIGAKKAAAVAKEFNVNVVFMKTDISSEAEVKKLIKETEKKFGGIDIMVNNAGIYPITPVLTMDTAIWEKTQAINLRGTFLCCREAGLVMQKKQQGSIINIASVDALHPSMVGLAAYDASKHGIWGFTKNFALEVAKDHIRVNAIAPGGIRTEGVEQMSQGQTLAAANPKAPAVAPMAVPMKRMGEPDEIATVTLFLASDAASYMTGAMVVVDGGLLIR